MDSPSEWVPCIHCGELPGGIRNEGPKYIDFDNRNFSIMVGRTWGGMNWEPPSNYTLQHWCPAHHHAIVKVRGKTMNELQKQWEAAQ